MPDRANPVVARALECESREVLLWDRLGDLCCPVLILRGGQPGALVTDEVAAMYRQRLAQVRLVTLEYNGRELWRPDFDSYIGEVGKFLENLNGAVSP
jgi:pimeloyl-ACP methyl ester carboxylesterase